MLNRFLPIILLILLCFSCTNITGKIVVNENITLTENDKIVVSFIAITGFTKTQRESIPPSGDFSITLPGFFPEVQIRHFNMNRDTNYILLSKQGEFFRVFPLIKNKIGNVYLSNPIILLLPEKIEFEAELEWIYQDPRVNHYSLTILNNDIGSHLYGQKVITIEGIFRNEITLDKNLSENYKISLNENIQSLDDIFEMDLLFLIEAFDNESFRLSYGGLFDNK